MNNSTDMMQVDDINGFTIGPTTSPTLSAISCTLPNIPANSFFVSVARSSSLCSSRFRFPDFFFSPVFRLLPGAPPSSFFRNSLNKSFAKDACPSLTPFSIAPFIQLLFDHSILQVMSIRVVEPPAHIMQNFVMTWNEEPEGTSGVVVV